MVGAVAAMPLAARQAKPAAAPAPELVLAQRGGDRVRPPAAVTCSRDDLTLYAGKVTKVERQRASTSLTIATDWNTIERVTIKHPEAADASAWFLMKGKPFAKTDWAVIEPGGTLRPGVRAAAWVCRDGRNPIVDWEAPSGAPRRYLP